MRVFGVGDVDGKDNGGRGGDAGPGKVFVWATKGKGMRTEDGGA